MSDVATAIGAIVTFVSDKSFPLLAALAGVSILSMAMVDIIKAFPVRRYFQKKKVRAWVSQSLLEVFGSETRTSQTRLTDISLAHLKNLALNGNDKVLYNLPTDQFSGQLSVAAQSVLDQPLAHIEIFFALTQKVHPYDLAVWLLESDKAAHIVLSDFDHFNINGKDEEEKERSSSSKSHWEQVLLHLKRLENMERSHLDEPEFERRNIEARNRIAAQVQRVLDSLQLEITHSWKMINQAAAIIISTAIIFAAMIVNFRTAIDTPSEILTWAVVAVLGGAVAPVASDVLSGLQRIKKSNS